MRAVRLLRRFPVVALAAGLGLAVGGCGSASPSAATVSFQGESAKIDRSDFERELEALNDNEKLQEASGGSGLSGAGKKTVDPRLAAGWLTFVIQDKLVAQEVERRRLTVSPADVEAGKAQIESQFGSADVAEAFPEWFRKRLVDRNARAATLRAALSGLDLSEEALRKYFDEHKAEFSQNCLSHILVRTKAEADAAVARVKGGEDFAAVAREVSIDTGSGSKGGDLGCNPRGVFVPEFDQAASELPVNQLSDLVQTQYGFHILLVKERKDASFESAREQLQASISSETQGAYREFLRQAMTSARITVDKRYGTFSPQATGQVPVVVPPNPPQPNAERTDNTPTTLPLEGELPDATPPE